MSMAAVWSVSLLLASAAPAATGDTVRPFRVHVPEKALTGLRRRIAATRWPDKETLTDQSQGGHFAAWEQPELFSAELRAAFKTFR